MLFPSAEDVTFSLQHSRAPASPPRTGCDECSATIPGWRDTTVRSAPAPPRNRLSNASRGPSISSGNPGHSVCHRSEEHTSELQLLMRTSFAVFCLKKKTNMKNKY